jgi:hypothetical protein
MILQVQHGHGYQKTQIETTRTRQIKTTTIDQTPIYFPTNNIPCMMLIWSLQSSTQARCEQMYIQQKCINETSVLCS